MKKKIIISTCLFTFILSGCNVPDLASTGQEVADTVDIEAQSEAVEPSTAVPDTPSPTEAPATQIPITPNVPDDWVRITSPELHINLYRPVGWEITYSDERHKLDVIEGDGPGWLEISLINEDTADLYNLLYNPGDPAEGLMVALLDAAQEDGNFGPSREVMTFEGYSVFLSNGALELIGDNLMIGVVDFESFALLVTGHVVEEDIDIPDVTVEVDRLMPIYEDIILNIGLLDLP